MNLFNVILFEITFQFNIQTKHEPDIIIKINGFLYDSSVCYLVFYLFSDFWNLRFRSYRHIECYYNFFSNTVADFRFVSLVYSTIPPSGNQVDGLPLVLHAGVVVKHWQREQRLLIKNTL